MFGMFARAPVLCGQRAAKSAMERALRIVGRNGREIEIKLFCLKAIERRRELERKQYLAK